MEKNALLQSKVIILKNLTIKISNYFVSQIIGDPTKSIQTRASLRLQGHTTFILQIEPKHIDMAIRKIIINDWKTMQEEHDQF